MDIIEKHSSSNCKHVSIKTANCGTINTLLTFHSKITTIDFFTTNLYFRRATYFRPIITPCFIAYFA